MWIEGGDLCLFMGPKDVVQSVDTCNYFVKGLTTSFGFAPLSYLTKEAAGWAHNVVGYSCKRCEYWDPEQWKCAAVDEMSPGYDLGIIHPDGCCNFWSADAQRGSMKTEEFYSFT